MHNTSRSSIDIIDSDVKNFKRGHYYAYMFFSRRGYCIIPLTKCRGRFRTRAIQYYYYLMLHIVTTYKKIRKDLNFLLRTLCVLCIDRSSILSLVGEDRNFRSRQWDPSLNPVLKKKLTQEQLDQSCLGQEC